MSNSYLKHLRKNKWFHGTTLAAWHDICKQGIVSNYNKGNELDFGYGFYLTPIKEQAEHFISTMLEYRKQESFLSELNGIITDTTYERLSRIAIVIEFTFSPMEWMMSDRYKYLILNNYDDNFAEFVFHNRINNANGENQHDYDFIFGVMSTIIETGEELRVDDYFNKRKSDIASKRVE